MRPCRSAQEIRAPWSPASDHALDGGTQLRKSRLRVRKFRSRAPSTIVAPAGRRARSAREALRTARRTRRTRRRRGATRRRNEGAVRSPPQPCAAVRGRSPAVAGRVHSIRAGRSDDGARGGRGGPLRRLRRTPNLASRAGKTVAPNGPRQTVAACARRRSHRRAPRGGRTTLRDRVLEHDLPACLSAVVGETSARDASGRVSSD